MGVPVITLAGATFTGRLGVSYLSNAGLAEYVTDSPTRYVDLAVSLSRDPNRLASLREGLRARVAASPLCDAATFVRDLEQAYRAMWRKWCAV
jgi:predicted O-linked N-acetylglucosamine transferase (SPINDLY family)